MLQRRRFRIVDRVMMTLRGRSAADRFARLIAQLLCHRLTANMRQRQTYLESALRNADRIVSPGRLSLDILARRGLPTRNMRLVPNGLNFDAWQFAPRSPFTGGLRVGYVGQLAPHKGVHLLIQAFEQLASDPGLHELKIYGDPSRDPSYSRQLLNLALGNPKIRFCGTYDNGQVETVMSGIDVLVVPSTWFEPAPMVIMEAQAAKVPVVASRLPNMQSAVRDGVDGLLFESGNVTDLARQLRRLAQEPGLLHQLSLGIGAVRSAIDEMCEIESIYRSVLAERSRCPGFSPAGTSG